FHARSIPSISIYAYLTRILKYCPCANECFLAVLVYFDRISLRIDSYNIHRLLISGVMVASKLYSDVFFTNTRYAKVGGLPVVELNMLELEFIAMNQFSLFVSVEELQHYGDQLLSQWVME
ncbi:cyclin PHO80-like protein, partial [Gilbertella persicaria]|uniref:cyclin PHO80-like protein n=1 Tax=Gilbertella persicaria TaxID=101096 RepID=UPI002220EC74